MCVTLVMLTPEPGLNRRDGLRLPGSILQGILARAALALLRIYLGVVFLVAAWPKVTENFTPVFRAFLREVALVYGHQFYRGFVEGVVLPNAHIVAGLLAWSELLVGVLLVLGLLTRLGSAVGFLLALNYMFAQGNWFWTPSSSHAAFALISLALLIGAAGRTFGLDAYLARRRPRSALW
jgi:thiosulfate dehydrogenase (quinone) large subunit